MYNPAWQELPEPMFDHVDRAHVDRARAQEYALLATLLSHSPDALMLERLALLRGDESLLGVTHAALARAAAKANAEIVKAEYFDLFEGVGRSRFLPYGSYYLTGSVYGRPLVRLRETLQSFGVEREAHVSEPEDHAAILCEIMAGLVGGQIAAPAKAEREFFDTHVAPWMGRFFGDLERAESADFYPRVGAVGRTFLDVERELQACLEADVLD